MRGGNPVRRTGVVDVLRSFDESGRLHERVPHRNDLIILAVQHERRDVELGEIAVKSVSEKALTHS